MPTDTKFLSNAVTNNTLVSVTDRSYSLKKAPTRICGHSVTPMAKSNHGGRPSWHLKEGKLVGIGPVTTVEQRGDYIATTIVMVSPNYSI